MCVGEGPLGRCLHVLTLSLSCVCCAGAQHGDPGRAGGGRTWGILWGESHAHSHAVCTVRQHVMMLPRFLSMHTYTYMVSSAC